MIVVRRIGPDDWQEWRVLRLAGLAEAPYAFRSTLEEWSGTGDIEEHWRTWLDDIPLTLVADLDGRPVGMVCVTGPDSCEIELAAIWVAPGARGKGVGGALVEAALDWGRDQGAERAVLEVLEENLAAIDLYRRMGFMDRGPTRASDDPYQTRAMTRDLAPD